MAVAKTRGMRGVPAFLIALSLVGCGGSGDGDDDAVDSGVPPPTGPWGGARRIDFTVQPNGHLNPTLSPDRLEIFVEIQSTIGRATRATVDDPFSTPEFVDEVIFEGTGPDAVFPWSPRLTPDGLTLYFTAMWPRGDIANVYRVTRPAIGGAWSAPERIDALNLQAYQGGVSACASGDQLVFEAATNGPPAIYEQRDGQVRRLEELLAANTSQFPSARSPAISPDCLTLYFVMGEMTNGVSTNFHWVTRRATPADPWGTPQKMPELLGTGGAIREAFWVSPDQHHLVVEEYFYDEINRETYNIKLLEFSR